VLRVNEDGARIAWDITHSHAILYITHSHAILYITHSHAIRAVSSFTRMTPIHHTGSSVGDSAPALSDRTTYHEYTPP